MATTAPRKPFSGIFLVPGVSRNRRLYTKEMIGKAVARMQARIADPDGLPICMRTHHKAEDNSRLIVGRVVGVEQLPDGRARYDARWYDTAPARDIAELVDPADGGPPGLRSVSIHGWFIDPKQVNLGGETVQTSTDLEIDFIDFTANPGVTGALIDTPGEPAESAPPRPGCIAVYETWEDPMPGTETGEALPVTDEAAEAYTAQQKRDALAAGQAMKNASGKPAYTIKNKSDLRRAIKAVGRGGADHDAIRRHVMDRAKALGLSAMIPDNWKADGSLKESAATRFGEIREHYGDMDGGGAGFAIDAYNGPISLTLRAPSLDPSSLRAVAAAAMTAALDALCALDPDMDADIDIPGAPAEDSDDDMGEDRQDPDAATRDDDEETFEPDPGAAASESAPAKAAGGVVESAPVLVGEQGPELFVPAATGYIAPQTPGAAEPDPAPEPAPETSPEKESAVSETETQPAAEAATTPAAPAPVVQMTEEMFTRLLDRLTPKVAEAAPVPAPQSAPVEQTAAVPAPAPATETQAAPEPAPAQETFTKADVAAAVAEALAASIPALRDSLVSQYGLPPRTGIRTSENDKNGAEMTAADMWDKRADLLLGNLGK